jgi:hypothetical protein
MKNLRVFCPLVNGEQFSIEYESGKQLIQQMASDAWSARPTALVLEAQTSDGRTVRIIVPYDNTQPARAIVEGKE